MKNTVAKKIGVNLMNKRLQEILFITQEECAEVTQAISKVFRFGFDDSYNGKTNKQCLEEEIGDLECMIELLKQEFAVDRDLIDQAKIRKSEKLNIWSTNIKTKIVKE
jgi:NTP pyrophosphatase (non-canonical NTP hydrolase)